MNDGQLGNSPRGINEAKDGFGTSIMDGIMVGPGGPYGVTNEFWYRAGQVIDTALASQTMVANRLSCVPHYFPRDTVIDKVAIEVTTGSAGNGRVGIYENRDDFYPGNLIYDSGDMDVTNIAVLSKDAPMQLPGGKVYWFAAVTSSTPVVRSCSPGTKASIFGTSSAFGAATSSALYTLMGVYGPLPAQFPVNPTLLLGISMPGIAFRVIAVRHAGI